jgi:adenosylcobinamide kinase/adenosylcobinamide-phosphate guanylyltransferase
MITLLTGGVKSGKSSRALEIARGSFTFPASFIATAATLDDEMRVRIRRHQAERAGWGFGTIEEQVEIGAALKKAEKCVVIDCITMWVNNLIYLKQEDQFERILQEFILEAQQHDCVAVTNEAGWGNIPFDPETRRYNMLLAEANKRIAEVAGAVELLVCGIPVGVKK